MYKWEYHAITPKNIEIRLYENKKIMAFYLVELDINSNIKPMDVFGLCLVLNTEKMSHRQMFKLVSVEYGLKPNHADTIKKHRYMINATIDKDLPFPMFSCNITHDAALKAKELVRYFRDNINSKEIQPVLKISKQLTNSMFAYRNAKGN